MSDTLRVPVVLENGADRAAVEAALLADVRRVEVEGVIDVADTTPSPGVAAGGARRRARAHRELRVVGWPRAADLTPWGSCPRNQGL